MVVAIAAVIASGVAVIVAVVAGVAILVEGLAVIVAVVAGSAAVVAVMLLGPSSLLLYP